MNEQHNITQEYNSLSEESRNGTISDQYVFNKVSELDKKYKNNEFHISNFEGILSNIGADQKSIPILSYVIKRLKKKKHLLQNDKYCYDLANTILTKANIGFNEGSRFNYLITASSKYKESRSLFLQVRGDNSSCYERAITNVANTLNKYGRNYEALFMYDKVLEVNPSFGMALGNKALALAYYTRLAPQQSLVLLNNCYYLLKAAVSDPALIEVGGQLAWSDFKVELESLEEYLNEIKFTPKKRNIPKGINEYQRFILEHNLYLNYDFGYYYDKQSLIDNFFPNLIEDIRADRSSVNSTMSKKTYFTFQVFNQIMEDFTTSRYNYFKALSVKSKKIDKNTNYIYTYDFTRHSLQHGMLKSVFATLYNCLDKIAHLVKYNFTSNQVDVNRVNIYFDWLTTDEFKEIILKHENYQLLSLYSLALDFKDNSPYYNLNKLRNRITHSFINIYEVGFEPNDLEYYESTFEKLTYDIYTLFVIVKSAILYSVVAIKSGDGDSGVGNMNAVMQNDIY